MTTMKQPRHALPAEASWGALYAGLQDIREAWRFARYLWIRGLLALFRRLPVGFGVILGRGLGKVGFWVLTRYRNRTIENLGASFPDADARGVRRLASGCMMELGASFAYAARLTRMRREAIADGPVVRGRRNLGAALEGESGCVVVSGHLGCWELLPAYLASIGLDVSLVAERLAGRLEDDLLRAERRKLGVGEVGGGVARLKKAVRELNSGSVVVCPYDQDAGLTGYFVPFFGRRAFVPSLPLRLALLSGSPILPAYASKEGGRHVLTFEPPIELRSEEDLPALARECVSRLEGWIRERPEQWPWMHRRWRRVRESGGPDGRE